MEGRGEGEGRWGGGGGGVGGSRRGGGGEEEGKWGGGGGEVGYYSDESWSLSLKTESFTLLQHNCLCCKKPRSSWRTRSAWRGWGWDWRCGWEYGPFMAGFCRGGVARREVSVVYESMSLWRANRVVKDGLHERRTMVVVWSKTVVQRDWQFCVYKGANRLCSSGKEWRLSLEKGSG